MNITDYMTCEAFTRAVPLIGQPSSDLKTKNRVAALVHQIESPQFAENSATIAAEIRELVKEYPELDQAYQIERQKLQSEHRNSDRAKGIALSFDYSRGGYFFRRENGVGAKTTRNTTDFWERGDRILVMAAGGAILGGMLAQIPGAVLGAVLAGTYGWYTKNLHPNQLTAAKLDILRALDKRPYTAQDLLSFMSITTPPDQVRAMVQSLWLQGYIDTVSGGLLRKFFPASKGQSPQLPDPDVSLTLTSKGHFSVHPIFRFGLQKAMFR